MNKTAHEDEKKKVPRLAGPIETITLLDIADTLIEIKNEIVNLKKELVGEGIIEPFELEITGEMKTIQSIGGQPWRAITIQNVGDSDMYVTINTYPYKRFTLIGGEGPINIDMGAAKIPSITLQCVVPGEATSVRMITLR